MNSHIDVESAFDPELRKAQADFDAYLAGRPASESDLEAHDPFAADMTYEEMSLTELRQRLGEAQSYSDDTTEENITDELLARIEDISDRSGLTKEGRVALSDRIFSRLPGVAVEQPSLDIPSAPNDRKNQVTLPSRVTTPLFVDTVKSEDTETDTEPRYTLESHGLQVEKNGEDAILVDHSNGLYGVFDGAGGAGGDPRAAARAAQEAISQSWQSRIANQNAPVDSDRTSAMRAAFRNARKNVAEVGQGGTTTAVVAKIEDVDGVPYLLWGNAGDSRLFIRRKDGVIESISTEQCHPVRRNAIYNAFADMDDEGLDEFGMVPLERGDRIMLCSDGITGDWEEQQLTEEEMSAAFSAPTVRQSAEAFLQYSKKSDDKSVIVVDVK